MTPLYKRLISPATLAALDSMHAAGNTTGTTPDDDLDTLAAILSAAGAKRVLQFGTFIGGSALVLADLAYQAGGPDAKVVTVDPDPAMNASCRNLAQQAGLAGVIETVDGYSTDPKLIARWLREPWDAIYLDTTHQFADTYNEIHARAPLCLPAALFLFHDASQHAADTLDMGRQGGVKRAIQEYCLLNPKWQHFIFERAPFGQFGIGLMQKRIIG